MDRRFPERSSEQRRARFRRRFTMGVLLVIVAVGSSVATVLVLLYTGHLGQASATTSSSTPTAIAETPVGRQTATSTSTAVMQGSLYTAEVGSLTRIDLQTGKVVWTINVTSPTAPFVMGKTLYFDNEDSSNTFLEAASVESSRQLWRSAQYPNGFLLGENNALYDSTCNLYAISDPCRLYGINASTGAQLWSYDLPQGNGWIALQNGVLYGVSYTNYFALNASTGVPLWQKNLLRYPNQEAIMTPVVSGNVLSFGSCNTTKQTSGYQSCYLYAFNAGTGAELWHMLTPGEIQVTPVIMDGVVYAGAVDGTIYALDEQHGTQLWSASAGGAIGQLQASTRTIYIEIRDANYLASHVEALDATTHRILWQQNGQNGSSFVFEPFDRPVSRLPLNTTMPGVQRLPPRTFSGGPADNPFLLDHGLIYIHSRTNIVDVLSANDGSQLAEYSVPGVDSIYGFTVTLE